MNNICGLKESKHLYSGKRYLSEEIKSAILYANKQHAGQIRKSLDKEPVIIHCLHVGDTLAKVKSTPATIIAGILHDTVEDTNTTKSDLRKLFGEKVSNLVNDVTEQDVNAEWLKKCRDYIEHLKSAPREALCISAADKIDNMSSITDSISRKYNIFENMVGTPKMQLKKFREVYKVIKGKIPQELEKIYITTMRSLIKTLKQFRYL